MHEPTFSNLDIIELQRMPNLSAVASVGLGRALLATRPDLVYEPLDVAAKQLDTELVRAEAALDTREREAKPEDITEVDYDRAVDALWTVFRNCTIDRAVFERVGFQRMTKKRREQIALPDKRATAKRARQIHAKLFGADGLKFLRSPFIEQGQHTATRLRIIEDDNLTETIDALAGFDLVNCIRVCQAEYDEMVAARLARTGKTDNFSIVRARLRRYLTLYATSVVTLLDESKPATARVVLDALRPVTVIKALIARGGGELVAGALESALKGGGEGDEGGGEGAEDAEAAEGEGH